MKLIAIHKVYALAISSDLFISNESDNENSDIFYNSDQAVGLLDSEIHNSPLSLSDDYEANVKSKEDTDENDLKSV